MEQEHIDVPEHDLDNWHIRYYEQELKRTDLEGEVREKLQSDLEEAQTHQQERLRDPDDYQHRVEAEHTAEAWHKVRQGWMDMEEWLPEVATPKETARLRKIFADMARRHAPKKRVTEDA